MKNSVGHIILSSLGIVLLTLFLVSCSPKELTPKDLITWVEEPDNGFVKEKTLDDLVFKVFYKPLNYVIAKENLNKMSDSIYLKTKENIEGLQYVNLTIYPANGKQINVLNYGNTSDREQQEKIYYYSFTFQEDIYMMQGDEKLPCQLFNFARDHGLSPELNFALAFEHSKNKGDLKIVINDVVFGNGELNFIIKESDILSLPSLKM